MPNHEERLLAFLVARNEPLAIEPLTADASTREYFRIGWRSASAIACVYPEPNDPAANSYLDVTTLFTNGGLPVAEVYDYDLDSGVIIQEDLGNVVLRDLLLKAARNRAGRLLDEAISMIALIQTVTPLAYDQGSIASQLRFDREKLMWELDFFKTHYFGTFLKDPLGEVEEMNLTREFEELSAELESFASVLCHRYFHAANLMLDPRGRMRIIDHQDARIGSPAYDLVSLLLDRITEPPSREWLAEKRAYFLNVRRRLGLPALDEETFANEFRLQTIQRCLKAAGTFSYQSVNRGKLHFIPFIKPMFRISSRAAESLGRFPTIRSILEREANRPDLDKS